MTSDNTCKPSDRDRIFAFVLHQVKKRNEEQLAEEQRRAQIKRRAQETFDSTIMPRILTAFEEGDGSVFDYEVDFKEWGWCDYEWLLTPLAECAQAKGITASACGGSTIRFSWHPQDWQDSD